MMAAGDRAAMAVAKFADVPAFVRGLAFDDLPGSVVASAQRSLLDLIGIAAAGNRTRAAAIAGAYAATQLCGSDRNARILFDGRRAGIAGAAFAGASTIDAVDGHDGHVLTKGHAGVAILPALLALCDGVNRRPAIDGREFLTAAVAGYEVGPRVGLCMGPQHIGQGWHSGATVGVFSAAAGAARGRG